MLKAVIFHMDMINITNPKDFLLDLSQNNIKIVFITPCYIDKRKKNLFSKKKSFYNHAPFKVWNLCTKQKSLLKTLRFSTFISEQNFSYRNEDTNIYIQILKALKIEASEAIVFETSDNRMTAAKFAQIPVIGYWNTSFQTQTLSDAFLLTTSLSNIDYHYIVNAHKRYWKEPITITYTKRLIIRELTLDDIKVLYQIYQNPKITRYIKPMNKNLNVELEKHTAYIENIYGFYGFGLWGVFYQDTNELIGCAGIQNTVIDGKQEIELSYLIDIPHQGFGYAIESTSAILTYAANELEIDQIVAIVEKANTPSIQVAKKIGMSLEKMISYENRFCYLYQINHIIETQKRLNASRKVLNAKSHYTKNSPYEKKYK